MNSWCTCIASHLVRECQRNWPQLYNPDLPVETLLNACNEASGLTLEERNRLFFDYTVWNRFDRGRAVAQIEKVIQDRAEAEKLAATESVRSVALCSALDCSALDCSALEPSASSASARAESAESTEQPVEELVLA